MIKYNGFNVNKKTANIVGGQCIDNRSHGIFYFDNQKQQGIYNKHVFSISNPSDILHT